MFHSKSHKKARWELKSWSNFQGWRQVSTGVLSIIKAALLPLNYCPQLVSLCSNPSAARRVSKWYPLALGKLMGLSFGLSSNPGRDTKSWGSCAPAKDQSLHLNAFPSQSAPIFSAQPPWQAWWGQPDPDRRLARPTGAKSYLANWLQYQALAEYAFIFRNL